ncbi:MAG TPA: pilus assembly protein PilM [Kofleriaceae bacterium]|nr:pilus assembly protein PilM [Kofleriaceae bacterium]
MSRILGIDLGAYSVKVAVATAGFRNATVVDYYERMVPPGDEPHELRAARTLGELVREHRLDQDSAYASLSGDRVFIHVLEFGFKNLRRQDLGKAVGAELEGILPIDLEDMVYTFEPLPREAAVAAAPPAPALGGLADGADPAFAAAPAAHATPVAAPTAGMRVLACAGMSSRIRAFLELLEQQRAEPRGLIAAPASYPRLLERVAAAALPPGQKPGPLPPTAVIDIGHERTDVCVVVGGRAAYVRTLARGGRHLTEAIARTWRLPVQQAEQAKHTDGFIASTAEPAQSEAWARIHQALAPELGPLARDLRQTLVACRAKTGATVVRAVLVGGGARLRGLASFLAEQLHIEVSILGPADDHAVMGGRLAGLGVRADVAALACGVAFEGASGRAQFDLRQGDLAFKADLSFLRAKATPLAAAILVIIAFAAASAYAHLHTLRKAEAALDKRLALETVEAFGKQMTAQEVLDEVNPAAAGAGAAGGSPLPEKTARALLIEFNEALPPRAEVKIDVGSIDIKPGKVAVTGVSTNTETQNALAAIKALEASLKKSKCFADFPSPQIQPGSTDDTRTFTLTIKTACL